ncbi:expressed unknown protein [Seminavis robusta]|uniref:Uncharacterized protein n=1 Tax=Seminavis robusta TaxID=568900 RepID=A0A9N8EMT2_9STRA|nr:expressed unknown protein [Seminavis robusta]|eukprot:Sro1482_g276320.1 n/a (186) ;mRNA; r:22162-22719
MENSSQNIMISPEATLAEPSMPKEPAMVPDERTTSVATQSPPDSSSPEPPATQKRKAFVASDAAIVTPTLAPKRRRLHVTPASTCSSPLFDPSAANSTTPSHKDLYGDDDELESISIPSLRDLQTPHRRHRTYQRRNSVTKFSLQATAKHMSVLEAAKKTLEKLREQQGNGGNVQSDSFRSIFHG